MTRKSTRLKYLAAEPIVNGVGEAADQDDPTWPRYVRTTDIAGPTSLREETFASLPPEIAERAPLIRGDIVMTAAGTIGKSFRYEESGPACFAGYLVRFRAGPEVDPRFISYWMETQEYWSQIEQGKVASTIENFSAGKYRNLRIEIPLLSEQQAIADYLDTETARIETLIGKKVQIQDLFRLRLYSLIVEAIRSHEVPHVPLKRMARIIDCKHRTPGYVPSGIPVVSPGDIQPGVLDLSVCSRFVSEQDYFDLSEGERRAVVGDIIYSRNASIGIPALVATDSRFTMGQDVCIVRPNRSDGDGRFLQFVLETVGKDQLEEHQIGSTFSRINVSQIAELRIPAFPEVAQDEFASQWTIEKSRMAGVVKALSQQIELLEERRQALITAAVTGELEVAA